MSYKVVVCADGRTLFEPSERGMKPIYKMTRTFTTEGAPRIGLWVPVCIPAWMEENRTTQSQYGFPAVTIDEHGGVTPAEANAAWGSTPNGEWQRREERIWKLAHGEEA